MKSVYILAYEKADDEWVPYAVFNNIEDCELMKRPGDMCYEVPFIEELPVKLNYNFHTLEPKWMARGTTAEQPPEPNYTVRC